VFEIRKELDRVVEFNNFVLSIEDDTARGGLKLKRPRFDIDFCAEMSGYQLDPLVASLFRDMISDGAIEKSKLVVWPRERMWINLLRTSMNVRTSQATAQMQFDYLWTLISEWLAYSPPAFVTSLNRCTLEADPPRTFGLSLEPKLIYIKTLDPDTFHKELYVFPQVIAALDPITKAASPIFRSKLDSGLSDDEVLKKRGTSLKAFETIGAELQDKLTHTLRSLREVMSLLLSVAIVSDIGLRIDQHRNKENV
jgi:hypothetical protein